MKNENQYVDVSSLFERIVLHVPDEYLKDSFKTREAADAMYDRIVEKFMGFKAELLRELAEMQSREAEVMVKEKAGRIMAQFSAYIDSGLSDDKAWELVKLEVQRNAQDS